MLEQMKSLRLLEWAQGVVERLRNVVLQHHGQITFWQAGRRWRRPSGETLPQLRIHAAFKTAGGDGGIARIKFNADELAASDRGG